MNITLILILLGLAVMLLNVAFGLRLRRRLGWGMLALRLNQLVTMMVVFTVCYLTAALLVAGQPQNSSLLALGIILLLGAGFVSFVLRLIRDLVEVLG